MLRRYRPFHALLLIAAMLGVATSAACTPAPPPLRVEVWGDSLSGQSSSYISFYLGLSGKVTTRLHTFPGTAICDWFNDMRSELNPSNPAGFHPQAVVIQFQGDAFTPCMKNAAGVPYTGQALVNKYQFDAAGVVSLFTHAHVPVYFVSAPISRAQAAQGYVGNAPVGALFSKLPAIYPAGGLTRFIDGAAAVEWQGHYTDTLPCASWETCTGHWPDGTRTVVVREADGVHFCPVKEVPAGGGFTTCPVYMGGAARFAMAIAGPVLHAFHLS
jgi:hypothetical protein